MSPFASTLRTFRLATGMTQQELAARVGVTRGYLAALECDRKPAPGYEAVMRLCAGLGLSAAEASRLHATRTRSSRRFILQDDALGEAYELVHKIFAIVHELSKTDLQALTVVVGKFAPTPSGSESSQAPRPGRQALKPSCQTEESPM